MALEPRRVDVYARRMRTSLVVLLVCALAGTAAADKIAVVDLQKALQESQAGKAAYAELSRQQARQQRDLDAQRDEVNRLTRELGEQAGKLKPAERARRRDEVERRVAALQEEKLRAQDELRREEARLLAPILARLEKAITIVVAKQKYSYVLRADLVVYPKTSPDDITAAVIKTVDALPVTVAGQ